MLSYHALNAQLSDQIQHDRAAAARRAHRTDRPPSTPRIISHGFWRDRVVLTVTIRPTAHSR